MTIPDFQSIMLPLLKLAADDKVHTIRTAKEVLGEQFQLSEEELDHTLPSGRQKTFSNRVSWAKTYLERAGLLSKAGRGQFKITQRGHDVLANPPAIIDIKFLQQFKEFLDFRSRSDTPDNSITVVESEDTTDTQTPEEALQDAYKQLRDDLAGEILEHVAEMSPHFFEQLVLDLMLAMGYGGAQKTGVLTTAGADEGIDGVINEDRLGLDIVYLQAKRWGNQVGRPEIQKFVGALHGKRARKGVFLTTSTFSRDAHEYVATIDPKVILIDGARLAELMIDFNVGVSITQTFHVKRIDTDYFTED